MSRSKGRTRGRRDGRSGGCDPAGVAGRGTVSLEAAYARLFRENAARQQLRKWTGRTDEEIEVWLVSKEAEAFRERVQRAFLAEQAGVLLRAFFDAVQGRNAPLLKLAVGMMQPGKAFWGLVRGTGAAETEKVLVATAFENGLHKAIREAVLAVLEESPGAGATPGAGEREGSD